VDSGRVRPNAIVAKDGSGQFKTIAAAIAAYPKNLRGRYVIYVKRGVYDEYINIEKNIKNVFMFGDGPRKTIVTGRKSNRDGFSTFKTATFCNYSLYPSSPSIFFFLLFQISLK
jgi:pectinesterase